MHQQQVDDNLGSTWGYTTGMTVASTQSILGRLVDTVAKNGTYLLNISPMRDGTIPENQQAFLREIGEWLKVNGEAIYGTHNWISFNDGSTGGRGQGGLNIRFTVKGDNLFRSDQNWVRNTHVFSGESLISALFIATN